MSLPSSPSFWFEPAQGGMFQSNAGTTAAVANNDVVGYLPDTSGALGALTSAANDTTRPTLQGVGVHPYLSFDGTNDALRKLSSSGAYAAGAATWCISFRSNSNALFANLLAEGSTSSTNPVYALLDANSTTASTASALIRNDAGTTELPQATVLKTGVFDGNDHVYILVDDGTGVTPYLDGVAGTRVAYSRSGTLTLNSFTLGALTRSTVGGWWAGRVYGTVGYNRALTSTEISDATAYLTSLYLTPPLSSLVKVSGDDQGGTISTAQAAAMVVQALDASSNPVAGITVSFATTAGTLSVASAVTGSDGKASVTLTHPSAPQTTTVTARASTFSATFTQTGHIPLYGTHSAFPTLLQPAGPGDPLAGVGFLPNTGDTWVPIASATDEFTGTTIDLTKWRKRLPGGYDHYNDELERYIDGGITVSNGTCKLTAHARTYDPANPGHADSPSGFHYPLFDSGCISSHTLLSYGYFEARLKLPTGLGVWPAFWLLPNTNYQGEIDIMEFVNNNGTEHPNMIHHNNLCNPPGGLVFWAEQRENTQYGFWSASSAFSATYFTDDWHVLGCYWNELDNTTTIYIDGQPVVQRRLGPAGQLSAIIFNMAMGGSWPTTNGSGQAWTQPISLTDQVFEIDYCRVFQKSGKILTGSV